MKSFSEFAKNTKVAEAKITKDKFYKNEVYKQGEWVLTENGQVGKILRRGPNYVLCLTAEETTFRTWITNIKEVFEIGTDAYREYVMSLTPGQKTQKPSGTVKVKQTIPTDPIKDKMSHHEEKTLAQIAAETMLNPKFKSMKETWRYDYSAKIGNTDVKGLGADGVGGGDAPGMKLEEPKGTEGKPKVKKVKHSCATKVEHPEWGAGNCLKGEHTLLEDGTVTHYDVMFDHGLELNVSVEDIKITKEGMHEHAARPERNRDEIGTELPVDETPLVEPAIKNMPEHHQKDKDGNTIPHDDNLQEKMAKKDYDGDGKVESGKDEYFGSRDKAIKKAMGKKAMKKEETVEEGKKKGLWDNIHAKRKRGEKPAKKGDKDYPKTLNVEEKGDVEPGSEKNCGCGQNPCVTYGKEKSVKESLKQARKNVGAKTCWDGYKAKGTKMKGGKKVPNCVKEFSEWRRIAEKK